MAVSKEPKVWTRIAAAGGLALLTLSVFFILRNYGPQTALRRFHIAAVQGDRAGLQGVTLQDIRSQTADMLRQRVQYAARIGGQFEILRVLPKGRQAEVDVRYTFPSQGFAAISVWRLRRERGSWKVDADETYRAMLTQGVNSLR